MCKRNGRILSTGRLLQILAVRFNYYWVLVNRREMRQLHVRDGYYAPSEKTIGLHGALYKKTHPREVATVFHELGHHLCYELKSYPKLTTFRYYTNHLEEYDGPIISFSLLLAAAVATHQYELIPLFFTAPLIPIFLTLLDEIIPSGIALIIAARYYPVLNLSFAAFIGNLIIWFLTYFRKLLQVALILLAGIVIGTLLK